MEWNFAWGNLPEEQNLRDEALSSILHTTESYGLKPVYYSTVEPEKLHLPYHESVRETWMILPPDSLVKRAVPEGLTVTVLDKSEEDMFLSIYEEAFSSPESIQNQKPDLDSAYLFCLKTSFSSGAGAGCNWIGKMNGEPVCIATLLVHGEMAGLYNVGTRLKDQGRGYGWQITQHVIQNALSLGIRWIYLQTEQGSTVEKFYSRMGFVSHSSGYYLKLRK